MAEKKASPSTLKGLKEGWYRTSIVARRSTMEKVKRYSYWGRTDIKDVIDQALIVYLKGKNTKPIPG